MDSLANGFSSREWSRRQFGAAISGGAFLLAAGGIYGVTAGSGGQDATSVRTAFGTVSVLRAKRFARLDAHGHASSSNLLAATFRTAGSGRENIRTAAEGAAETTSGHGHGDAPQNQAWPQPVNLTWGDVLVLETEIHNARQGAVLFSPAQLRLKLVASGTTITHQDCDRDPGALEAGARERTLISYLAPHSVTDLELEFSDVVRDNPLRLALPPLTATEVVS